MCLCECLLCKSEYVGKREREREIRKVSEHREQVNSGDHEKRKERRIAAQLKLIKTQLRCLAMESNWPPFYPRSCILMVLAIGAREEKVRARESESEREREKGTKEVIHLHK